MRSILITGACGMIGKCVTGHLLDAGFQVIGVDRCDSIKEHEKYIHIKAELSEVTKLDEIFEQFDIDRVIHLAALAHSIPNVKLTSEDYYNTNVLCSRNVFILSAQRKIPVLFISTVDVYGFTKGIVDENTVPQPVTYYGKSKYLAEKELVDICTQFDSRYDIYRFAPVYTDEVKRDIQKRYYLRYPDVAYIVGKGQEYEFLHIDNVCAQLEKWIMCECDDKAHNIKNDIAIKTKDCIEKEKAEGHAKYILKIPEWVAKTGFYMLRGLTGKNKYTYLLNKLVNPIRTR